MNEKMKLRDSVSAQVSYAHTLPGQWRRLKTWARSILVAALVSMLAPDALGLQGVYHVTCVGPDGCIKWEDKVYNLVTTVGQNFTLDTLLGGSAYTVTGPYMGLVSSTSFSAYAAGDTMASHSGWLEAGNAHAPTYSGTRGTVSFSAASAGAKTTSAAVVFSITGSGTVKGLFIVLGPSAVNTIDDTGGKLLSVGAFSGGDKVVGSGDTINASYTLSG